jgi:hypothetical protein
MNKYIDKAINKLAVLQDDQMRWSYSHSISSQSDLDNISVEDGKSFNFNWQDVQSKANELEQADIQEKQNAEANKASALAKLSALGLTEEEVQAIIK